MSYVDDGFTDDAGSRQHQKTNEDAQGMRCENGNFDSEPSFRSCSDGLTQRAEEKEELAVAIARTWSGLIPPPEDFNAYE